MALLQVSLHRGTKTYTQSKLFSYINHADLTSLKQLKGRPLSCLQRHSLLWVEAFFPGGGDIRLLSNINLQSVQFSSFQSLSHVQLFATPWTAEHQASLSITNSWSLPKLMSIESVMTSNHLILCHHLLLLPSIFPSIRVFSNNSVFFASGGQSIGVSASTSVLPMNTQDWSPLGWTGWISLQFKGLSRVFNTTVF